MEYFLRKYNPNKNILEHLEDSFKLFFALKHLYEGQKKYYESIQPPDQNICDFFDDETHSHYQMGLNCIFLHELIVQQAEEKYGYVKQSTGRAVVNAGDFWFTVPFKDFEEIEIINDLIALDPYTIDNACVRNALINSKDYLHKYKRLYEKQRNCIVS